MSLPAVQSLVSRSIREVTPHQSKLASYAKDLELSRQLKEQLARKKGDARAEEILPKQIKQIEQGLITRIPREDRRVLIIEKMHIAYAARVAPGRGAAAAAAPAGGTDDKERYFKVSMSVRTPLRQSQVNNMMSTLRGKFEANAQAEDLKSIRFHKLSFVYRSGAESAAGGSGDSDRPDPGDRTRPETPEEAFPGRAMPGDTRLDITVDLSVDDDGLDLDDAKDAKTVGKAEP